MSALAGRTVLVTRSRDQATDLCAALASRGARAVAFASIETVRVDSPEVRDCLASLDRFDWIVFTSANAVRHFWNAMRELGHSSLRSRAAVAAVGPATRRELELRGVSVSAIPQRYLGTELAATLGPLEGSRVLLPRSDIAGDETVEAFRARGAVVEELVIYRTVTASPTPEAVRVIEGRIDAVTFTSPSTVRGFLDAGGEVAERLLRTAVIACIGPVTAEAVRGMGLAVQVQPSEHTAVALVEALERHFVGLHAEVSK